MSLQTLLEFDIRFGAYMRDSLDLPGADAKKSALIQGFLKDLFVLSHTDRTSKAPYSTTRVANEIGVLGGNFSVPYDLSIQDATGGFVALAKYLVSSKEMTLSEVYSVIVDVSLSYGPGLIDHDISDRRVYDALSYRVNRFAKLIEGKETIDSVARDVLAARKKRVRDLVACTRGHPTVPIVRKYVIEVPSPRGIMSDNEVTEGNSPLPPVR